MAEYLARSLEHKKVRVFLFIFGFVATVFFVPLCLFSAMIGFDALLHHDAPDANAFMAYAPLSVGGILGLSAAWGRLLANAAHLRASGRLRAAISFGLCIGSISGALLLLGALSKQTYAYALIYGSVTLVGLLLLVATLGIQKSAA